MPLTNEDANVKENEETDAKDEGDLRPFTLELDGPHFVEFQDAHPDVLRKIRGVFRDPASIKIVVEAFMGYPDPHELKGMLSDHVGMITALTKRGGLTPHDFQQVIAPCLPSQA